MERYKKNSLSLIGTIALGTGVMIGAGILALLGQVAELAGNLFPLSFILGAIVTIFSAYSYIKMSNAYPSAGGIAMFLKKSYGEGVITAFAALLMAFSMIINESLVARTFGNYTLQLFNAESNSMLVPILGVGLLIFTFFINISGNKTIETFSSIMSLLKIIGISIIAFAGLWASNFSFNTIQATTSDQTIGGFIASIAFCILAYKGFTTITNSGSEIIDPHRNVGRAIIISIGICVIIYTLVSFAVAGNLSLGKIIEAKDYALAEAARPVFGSLGLWFTVLIAVIATVSGVIASVFAVSRMLAMLTDMQLIPHKHFGMPGNIQQHTLVYTVVIAITLTIFFDLSRIASMGAIFYLIMDILIHWGVLKYLHKKIDANPIIVTFAIIFDVIVLAAFLWVKASTDLFVVILSLILMVFIFFGEKIFLSHSI